jgi:hypothetical protein
MEGEMGARIDADYGVTKECKRQPAARAPHAYQMKTQPSTYRVGGKVVAVTGKGSDLEGGNMNGGGKRR